MPNGIELVRLRNPQAPIALPKTAKMKRMSGTPSPRLRHERLLRRAAASAEVDENRHARWMSPDRPVRPTSTARILALVALAGLVLGITAQLLRQMGGPVMDLGAATAPWLTVGFLLAFWTTWRRDALREASGLGVATMAVYLFVWLLAFHATFAIRESVTLAAAWREAAPWFLLAGPVSVVLGVAASVAQKRGVAGDVCLALPIAWSMPEIADNSKQGWSYALVVALPTAALALMPVIAVARRKVRLVLVVVAWALFAIMGLALLPVLRNYIHS
jgi:hypothetical protein